MAKIRITDLTLRAIIGTNAWERVTKQKIIINITFDYNFAKAVSHDNIRAAVDYKIMTKKIIQMVQKSKFFLLEKLAASILSIVMDNKRVMKATVRVDKPLALRFAKSVSVEVSSSI